MALNTLIDRLFGKSDKTPRVVAKDRLKLVLMHDRTDVPSAVMEGLRQDIIAAVSKWLDIDESALDVNLERDENAVALVANIPVHRVRAEAD